MKIAYTGTHGTGKSTSAFRLSYEYKLLFPNSKILTFTDLQSENPFKINTESDENSQLWIFSKMIQKETTLSNVSDVLITDRSIVDVCAYTLYYEFMDLYDSFISFAKYYIKTYDKIIFKSEKNNNYAFDNNGLRDFVNYKFRSNIDEIMLCIYERLIDDGYLNKHIFKIDEEEKINEFNGKD